MTFKNWLTDLWLTIWHGKWVISREFYYYAERIGFGVAPVKAEGQSVVYDSGIVYSYFIVLDRIGHPWPLDGSDDKILCGDETEAVALAAYKNALRGYDF